MTKYLCSRFYETGQGGLPRDLTQAAVLYSKSANQGNAIGESNLGNFYANGEGGLPRNDVQALI